jgi:hypothetical protein
MDIDKCHGDEHLRFYDDDFPLQPWYDFWYEEYEELAD